MTTKSLEKIGRRALLLSPVVLAIVGFFGTLYWFRPRNTTFVLGLTAVVSVFVMGYSGFLARRVQRGMDEVQIAHQEFANSRGWGWGLGISILLLLLTPVSKWLIDLANRLSTGSPDTSNRGSVQMALFFGLMLVAILQTACVVVASVVWERRMGLRDK